jgi:hypothetical protein
MPQPHPSFSPTLETFDSVREDRAGINRRFLPIRPHIDALAAALSALGAPLE